MAIAALELSNKLVQILKILKEDRGPVILINELHATVFDLYVLIDESKVAIKRVYPSMNSARGRHEGSCMHKA